MKMKISYAFMHENEIHNVLNFSIFGQLIIPKF